MCIRDSRRPQPLAPQQVPRIVVRHRQRVAVPAVPRLELALEIRAPCLLYTSDAADERSSVDLGGRRIIKKKKNLKKKKQKHT